MNILAILILPIHKCEIPFHLLVSSSISFINVLQFPVYNILKSFRTAKETINNKMQPIEWKKTLANHISDNIKNI